MILNLTGGPDLTMAMVNKAMDQVTQKIGSRNSIIMGASIDGSFYNQLRITVMGTVRGVVSSKTPARAPKPAKKENLPVSPPLKPVEPSPHRCRRSR